MSWFLAKDSTPRWIVLTIDLGICLFATLLAYLVRFNFSIPANEIETFPLVFPIVLGVRGLSFFLGKTYSGIIRYTSTTDTQRIFSTITLGSLGFMALNYIRFFFFDGAFVIPISVIIIDYLAVIFLMVLMRISVKLIYFEIISQKKNKENLLIYGAGDSGIITKRTLERDTQTNHKILGFIDDNPRKHGKQLEGIRIYPGSYLPTLLDKKEIDKIIISIQQLDRMKKEEITELGLNHRVEVHRVPPVRDWINGELSYNQIREMRIEDLLGRSEIKLDASEIKQQISGKTLLITGAAGSIGAEIVRQACKYFPAKIVLVDQAESALFDIANEISEVYGDNILKIEVADIRQMARMDDIMRKYQPEVVYHAAAYKHVPLMEQNPEEAILTNVMGTQNLADLAEKYGVKTFVMISTDKAVNPTNVMGASKRIAEIYVQCVGDHSKTRFITTRFGNVLGSNGSVIPVFRKQIENGGPITVTHPEIIRYFMTIPEACQLVLEAGTMGNGGEIFIFDMGEPVKIIDLAKKMIKLSGLELGRDIDIKFTGLRPGEKLYEELLADEENNKPTHHPQITIGSVRKYDLEKVDYQIKELIKLAGATQKDRFKLVGTMKKMVPEFKSNNSEYSALDAEKSNKA
ncbi:polysaccharide biosynthesis protein [bacterium SCSIO 12741]|nr:polysaccharide biosynthesis protein [bacterium SCSIO 12741]